MLSELYNVTQAMLAKATVLIVDDEPVNLEMVAAMVGQHHQTLTASNGEDALSLALVYQPDLILSDVSMSGLDGLELCRRLKANPRTVDIPVLFMTGLEHPDNESRCWQAGGVDFIAKPINSVTLTNRLRVHLTVKLQSEAMKKLALKDGLTGVYNRRYLDSQLVSGLKQRRRTGSDFSLLMIDVDYFKRYNDMNGHLQGDDCLKAVAKSIAQSVCRPMDVVGRFGGEEFMVLLPETSSNEALAVAQRVIDNLRAERLAHKGSSYGIVTASVGVASVSGSIGQVDSHQLILAADKALYEAKLGGRNRCCLAPSEFFLSISAGESVPAVSEVFRAEAPLLEARLSEADLSKPCAEVAAPTIPKG